MRVTGGEKCPGALTEGPGVIIDFYRLIKSIRKPAPGCDMSEMVHMGNIMCRIVIFRDLNVSINTVSSSVKLTMEVPRSNCP